MHVGGEAVEGGLVPRLALLLDGGAGVGAQVVVGPVVEGDADDRHAEQARASRAGTRRGRASSWPGRPRRRTSRGGRTWAGWPVGIAAWRRLPGETEAAPNRSHRRHATGGVSARAVSHRGLRHHRRRPDGRPGRPRRLDRLVVRAPDRLGRVVRRAARRHPQRALDRDPVGDRRCRSSAPTAPTRWCWRRPSPPRPGGRS